MVHIGTVHNKSSRNQIRKAIMVNNKRNNIQGVQKQIPGGHRTSHKKNLSVVQEEENED